METDILGQPYQQLTIDLGTDDEGPVVATLVRRRAPEPTRRAVLWVHGWSDYFFQTHVADFFTGAGFDFYALDLRKYGRSLRGHQTANYCRSLAEYLPELDEAARRIRTVDGHDTLLVAGHSTGALVTALWAHLRRADRVVDAMFLNSPFFDLNLPALLRAPAGVTAARLARRSPYGILRRPAYPVYGQSLHASLRGEWSYDLAWKPVGGFPIRYGWLAAVRAGQLRLQAGLAIDVPVLVACSTRSYRGLRWHELARRADTVLDVADMVRWAPQLGRHVTLLRVDGGMHDLTLSAPAVRAGLFRELSRWSAAYVAGVPPPPAPESPPAPANQAAQNQAAQNQAAQNQAAQNQAAQRLGAQDRAARNQAATPVPPARGRTPPSGGAGAPADPD